MNSIHHYDHVYYVEAPEEMHLNPVAIRPEIYKDRIQWMDTSKGTVLMLDHIDNKKPLDTKTPEIIEFTTKDGKHIKLINLTLKLYNQNVKERVMLPPVFNSDKAVQEFYLNTDFEIY